jgi:uncharacterized membrane-anchored protein YjiN (DUF445 family)
MDVLPPETPAQREAAARAHLARHKALAGGLLALMAALTVASLALPHGFWSGLLQAGAKAGVVGGIADWFAVTALFRHPLGLPIPHTAIIPAQKARLGRALGRFVAEHVFTQQELSRTLERLDLPGILHRFLADPAATAPAAEALAALLPRLLASLQDGRAGRVLGRIVPRLLAGPAAGRIVAQVLRKLVEGGRHQEVFGFVLVQLRAVLAEKEASLRAAIEARVREQGGALVGWALGAQVARRVLAQVNAELDRMSGDGSELRAAFDEWMRREIARIDDDPQRAIEIGRGLRRVLAHPSIRAWFGDAWGRLHAAMEQDANSRSGRTVLLVETVFANLGVLLETDPAARARVEQSAQGIVARLLPAAQVQLSRFIADAVSGWDTATVVERLELRVGPDLQFVRVNGTLVGFLVGAVLYGLLVLGGLATG